MISCCRPPSLFVPSRSERGFLDYWAPEHVVSRVAATKHSVSFYSPASVVCRRHGGCSLSLFLGAKLRTILTQSLHWLCVRTTTCCCSLPFLLLSPSSSSSGGAPVQLCTEESSYAACKIRPPLLSLETKHVRRNKGKSCWKRKRERRGSCFCCWEFGRSVGWVGPKSGGQKEQKKRVEKPGSLSDPRRRRRRRAKESVWRERGLPSIHEGV